MMSNFDFDLEDEPSVSEEYYEICPRCHGSGMDRWEEEECEYCFGEGEIPANPPVMPGLTEG